MDIVHQVYDVGRRDVGPSPRMVPNGGWGERRDVFHVSFDPETESAHEVVLDAVCLINDRSVEELDPLTATVDAEALDDLISTAAADEPGDVEVQFVYEGLDVTITGDGGLWLRRR